MTIRFFHLITIFIVTSVTPLLALSDGKTPIKIPDQQNFQQQVSSMSTCYLKGQSSCNGTSMSTYYSENPNANQNTSPTAPAKAATPYYYAPVPSITAPLTPPPAGGAPTTMPSQAAAPSPSANNGTGGVLLGKSTPKDGQNNANSNFIIH